MKRLDLKVGFVCNNNCVFCVQADNKLKGDRPFEDLIADLKEGIERGCGEVVLTGGEPTIRKDFFEIIKKAVETGYKSIQIQTNGRMFSNLDFCRKAIFLGMSEAAIALHGYCAEQHDLLTRAPSSFNQTTKGIKNISELNIPLIVNIVVVKQNYKYLSKIVEVLMGLGVKQLQFAVVHPMGNAFLNFDKIVPRLNEIAPYVKDAVNLSKKFKITANIEAMPPCLIEGYEDCISELSIPDMVIRGVKSQNTDNFRYLRITSGKIKSEECKKCDKYDFCEGPWKEYVEKWGWAEILSKEK